MKKWIFYMLLPLLLTGCGTIETLETISDEYLVPAAAVEREVLVNLPGEASVSTIQSDTGRLYLCDGYEISIETMDSGDLARTVNAVSGRSPEDLTIMTTTSDDVLRHEFVWAAAGENGERIGRSVILDDGNYHYVLTVLRDIEAPQNTQIAWNNVFHSFKLV